MTRRSMVAVAVLVAAPLALLGNVTAGPTLGDFEIDPDSGTAGNTIPIEASDDPPTCSTTEPGGFAVLGTFPSHVEVTLWNPAKTVEIDQEVFIGNFAAGWSVTLTMPASRPPGSYPISARCIIENSNEPFAEYDDQIFVLRAGAERADPVEADVTLTG